jgi:hypothetical protein
MSMQARTERALVKNDDRAGGRVGCRWAPSRWAVSGVALPGQETALPGPSVAREARDREGGHARKP